jgi:hypothetical protein
MPKRKKIEGRNSVDLATDFYSTPNANLVSFERKSVIKSASPRRKPTMLAYKTSKIQSRLEDPRTNPAIIPSLQTAGRKLGMKLMVTSAGRTEAEQKTIMQKMYNKDLPQYEKNYGKLSPDKNPFVSKHISRSAVDLRFPWWPSKKKLDVKKKFGSRLQKTLGKKAQVHVEGDHLHINYPRAQKKP